MSVVSPLPRAYRRWRASAGRAAPAARPLMILLSMLLSSIPAVAAAGDGEYQPAALSERIGFEIDRAERDAFDLFPDIEEFESARILRRADGEYRVEFQRREGGKLVSGSKRITEETFELTCRHVRLVETYRDVWNEGDPATNARVLYEVALRHALEQRYDLALDAFEELERSYPAAYDSLRADSLRADASRLAARPVGLFQRGTVIDRSGYTDLMIFAGYYGLWFGIAAPYALGGEDVSAEAVAAGFIFGPALSVLIAHAATSGKSITEGDADMVSLGGWFGTWQGLGWSGYAELDDQDCIQLGLVGGLVGIGLSAAYNSAVQPSEGYASLMFSSVWWGAWLGLVGAVATGAEDALPASLLGSDVLLIATAAAARDTGMTKKRVRLMNLGGVLGAFAGAGVCVLAHVEDEEAAAGVVGLTSLVGAGIAVAKSSGESGVRADSARSGAVRPDRWGWEPVLSVRAVQTESGRKKAPCFELVASF
jgi:hypothetical protein